MNILTYLTGCLWRGHTRGKRVTDAELPSGTFRTFKCDECGKTWARKVYPRRPNATPQA